MLVLDTNVIKILLVIDTNVSYRYKCHQLLSNLLDIAMTTNYAKKLLHSTMSCAHARAELWLLVLDFILRYLFVGPLS